MNQRNTVAFVAALAIALAACGDGDSAGTTAPETATTTTAGPGSTTVPEPSTTTVPPSSEPQVEEPTFETFSGVDTIGDWSGLTASGKSRWTSSVPVEAIVITSTIDGAEQHAWWLQPQGEDRPLLVILHSWSSDYRQHAGIPYAMWAAENGWAAIAPDFRGKNDSADAVGSDLAVQDVIDAIDFALSQPGVAPDLVYAVGYSGGGMMALLVAGLHPDRVRGVSAWGPPYDLIAFYEESASGGRAYAGHIRTACGGNPTRDEAAEQECLHRSPMTHLDEAREAGVAVMIGHGIRDHIIDPNQSARAFNQLAAEDERFTDEQLDRIGRGSLPEGFSGVLETETFFGEGDPAPVFSRRSGDVLLVYMDSDHEMVYGAAARWIASLLP